MCKSKAKPGTSNESSKVGAQPDDRFRTTEGAFATTSRAAEPVASGTSGFTSADADSLQTSSSSTSSSSSSSTEFIVANNEHLEEVTLSETITEVMPRTEATDDDAESRLGGCSGSNASLFQRISVGERLSQMLRLVAVSDGNDVSSSGGNHQGDDGAERLSTTSCESDSSTEGWNLVVDKAVGDAAQSSEGGSTSDADTRCELAARKIRAQFVDAALSAPSEGAASLSTTATNPSDSKSSAESVESSSEREKVAEMERRLSALVMGKMRSDPPSAGGQNQGEEVVIFRPPWSCSLGQMQECVRTLQRNAEEYCRNRNALVVFCRSKGTHLRACLVQVFNQIKDVLSTCSDYQLECVQPVFLLPKPADFAAVKKINSKFSATDTIFQSAESVQEVSKAISDALAHSSNSETEQRIIIKLQFHGSRPQAAANFRNAFNGKCVRKEFDCATRGLQRQPLAQWALTYPERQLRRALNAQCKEWNRTHQTVLSHDGVQLFKRNIDGGHSQLVRFEPNTKLQNLHAAVVSLRKYAATYRTKRSCVIVRNVFELPDTTEDVRHLWSLALRVVDTYEFRRLAADDGEAEDSSSAVVGVERVSRGILLPFPRLVRFTLRDAPSARNFARVFNQRFRVEANGDIDVRGRLAVAHADLSPPELALRYALLAFCRERNSCRVSAYKYACNPQHHQAPPAPRSRETDDHPNNCVYFFRQWRLFRVQQNNA